jgi:hypothetical protein
MAYVTTRARNRKTGEIISPIFMIQGNYCSCSAKGFIPIDLQEYELEIVHEDGHVSLCMSLPRFR